MFEPYLALHASAGSGKTYALSVRYISLLFLGAQPEKILTLTFTKKAAGEMKARIFDTIKNLEYKNELDDIADQVGVSKEEILKRKEEIFSLFLQGELYISTIDSFFTSILRKFSLNIGVMPDFKVDESILDHSFLEKFLRRCIQDKKYDSLIKLALNEEKKLSNVFELLNSFYYKEGEFDVSIFPKAQYQNPSRVVEAFQSLRAVLESIGATARVIKLFDKEDISDIITHSILEKESLSEHSWFKKCVNNEVEEKFIKLKEEIRVFEDAREKYILGELGELYSLYTTTIRVLNKELSTLSFSDVSVLIYKLLQNEISKEFLYFRLDSKIEHMLIDEYQDTSVLQYKILEPLMSEIVAGVGISDFKSLFFVGDTKQSIYRFRGGSKELFEYSVQNFGVKRDILDTNYRSTKNVVEFVNETFSKLIKGYEPQKVNSKKTGFVHVSISDEIDEELIANVKKLLSRGVAFKDIAILVHENKESLYLKELLEERIKNIKVQIGASIKLRNVPLISAIFDLLKYAYFKDKLYLQNFLVAIGKDFRDEVDISFLKLHLPPVKLIELIVQRFEIFEDDQDIITLLEISGRYSDIESFLFECDSFSEDAKSEDNNGVKILTIHKSKGLEFEHVFVLDRLKSSKGGGGSFIYEYDDINLVALYQRVAKREFLDNSYKRAKEKEEQLSYEDKLNMYYVAFTRAESSLFLLAKEKSSAFSILGLQECSYGEIEAKVNKEIEKVLLPMKNYTKSYGAQKQEEKDEEECSKSDFFAIEYGLATHYFLEMLKNFDIDSLVSAYKAMYNKYTHTLSLENLQNIEKKVKALIEDEKFKQLIENGKVLKEQPIMYQGKRKQIDLLIEKNTEVIIVDYKTSKSAYEGHYVQVEYYKKALSEIYNKKVTAYLCYLKEDNIELLNL